MNIFVLITKPLIVLIEEYRTFLDLFRPNKRQERFKIYGLKCHSTSTAVIIPNNDVSVSTDSTPSNSPFSPSVVPCPLPDIPNSVTDDAAPLSPDTELTVVCLDNYQLVGTTVSCVSGSKFSGDLPQCSGTGRGFFLGMALFMFI